ncbi:MAG: DUF4230 domain-containing protein [Saprospiraceae bacterium]
MKNKLLIGLLLVLVFGLGGWLALKVFAPKPDPVEQSTVLLEKIDAVCKLVTVEGQFSEIYNYDEYQGYFTLFWDKKALVRVRATVAAGYDLEQLVVEADPNTKTIHMSAFPEAEILSIDHNLDYYDISNGFFTEFSAQDYNRINAKAKEMIRKQALNSSLLPAAQEQAETILGLIQYMVESAGWTLEVDDPYLMPQ